MSDTQNIQSNPSSPNRYNLFYTGDISENSVHNIRVAFAQALTPNVSSINFFFSSTGGCLYAALSLYHFLRALPKPITIYNVGTIESAAVLVYMAADTRLTSNFSWFLIHNSSQSIPNNTIDAPRLAEMNRTNNKYAEVYAQIINERTKGASSNFAIYERLRGDASSLIIDPDTALDIGIVTGISPIEGIISCGDAYIDILP